MQVIVVGCGRVGAGLARSLEEAGHGVSVIDRRSRAFTRLPEGFGGRTIVGVGFDRDRLEEAGIAEAEAVAAVTSGDNSNILVARIARETYGIERVVARIYDPSRAKIYERLGIPTIATVDWARERFLRRILPDRPQVDWLDSSARVALLERPLGPGWAGRRVEELDAAAGVRVAAVTRLGDGMITRPDLILQDGDVLHLMAEVADTASLDRVLADGSAPGGS